MIEFLRKIPAKTLAKKQNAALADSVGLKFLNKFSYLVVIQNKRELLPFAFVPCAEPEGPNAFITEHPQELLKRGEFNAVPYITGINQMEGMIMLKRKINY